MTNPLATADFFALEAGECLDRLELLARRDDAPPAEDFLRASRVLRGSALMASQQAIARAAGALENVARALREGRRAWDPECREQVAQAIEEFRRLVRRVREWDDGDAVRAGRLAVSLDTLAGRSAAEPGEHRGERGEINAGVRAFVGREGALIASALDRAARALQVAPGDREPLYTVIRRMQSLRGLAELTELAPLPEILDGIELAVGDLTRLFAPPPGVHEVMAAAALALTRISRDIAERGRSDPDAEEARVFTDLLLRAFAVERDVVPIESLYHEGDPSPYTPAPGQPQFEAPAPLGPLELVSHGEHLCQIADLIARASSATERDLRLYHLIGALRTAAVPGPDPVAGALAVFARSTREALAAGVSGRSTEELVAGLRAAGELLRSVADAGDRMQVSRRLLDVAYRLDQARGDTREIAASPPQPQPEPTMTQAEKAPVDLESDVVPIESLAPDPATPSAAAEASALETSFRTLERLERERGSSRPSIEGLVGSDQPVEAVAIESLCYRGRSALERAADVRGQLAAALAGASDLATIRPLLQELLDLVPLALDQS
jgi:chemotaxis protein histidine kinase CheA